MIIFNILNYFFQKRTRKVKNNVRREGVKNQNVMQFIINQKVYLFYLALILGEFFHKGKCTFLETVQNFESSNAHYFRPKKF